MGSCSPARHWSGLCAWSTEAPKMNVYVLLVVVFAIVFVAPCFRLLYLTSFLPCLERLYKAAVRAKRRWDSRKSAFEMEVERIREQYGIDRSSSELQV